MIADTENPNESCPENCDAGILKSCPSDPGRPCPVCEDGVRQLQKAFESHRTRLNLQTHERPS